MGAIVTDRVTLTMSAIMEDGNGIGTDTIIRLLSNERRRYVIESILSERTLTKRQLLTRVCEREFGYETIPTDEIHRIQIGLKHNHLPKLADYGVIEIDDETITVGPNGDELAPYLKI